jgi:hypothetical protein
VEKRKLRAWAFSCSLGALLLVGKNSEQGFGNFRDGNPPIGKVQKCSDNCFASHGLVSISKPAPTSNRDHPVARRNDCRKYFWILPMEGLSSLQFPNPGSDNFSDKGMHVQWLRGALEPNVCF